MNSPGIEFLGIGVESQGGQSDPPTFQTHDMELASFLMASKVPYLGKVKVEANSRKKKRNYFKYEFQFDDSDDRVKELKNKFYTSFGRDCIQAYRTLKKDIHSGD